MKRIYRAYRQLLGILASKAPWMVISTFVSAIIIGLLSPLGVWINSLVLDSGLQVANGSMSLNEYWPIILAFILCALLPGLLQNVYIYGYVEPHALLILRTAFREKMLKKAKTLKYEHFENEADMEIIDKAYNRADNSARHLFPMYLVLTISGAISGIGVLWLFGTVKWWLILTLTAPFILETYLVTKNNKNIYVELESYWKKERQYHTLGGYLRSRNYVKETKLYDSSDYLIGTYRSRLHSRNKEYERFYFRHLKETFTQNNLTKLSSLVHAVILLILFLQNQMSVGVFIALTLQVFGSIYGALNQSTFIFRWSGYHINFFDYYQKYFELSDDPAPVETTAPEHCSVEFRDVWFRYPGTERDILKGLSFSIQEGEHISIVGENGEGKTTMIKLLMGLFTPDSGEILLNGERLQNYSSEQRAKIFAPVFQDFIKYSISLSENIGVGDSDNIENSDMIAAAAKKAGVEQFAVGLPEGYETLLGRDFSGGVDISGGQWQRIAIARSFMGNKPFLLLDEPTSQLDPMAESALYSEFAEMARGKTALFITHRLASTMITDRILVIHNGVVSEEGTHEELMARGGRYAQMFQSQRQWYHREEVAVNG